MGGSSTGVLHRHGDFVHRHANPASHRHLLRLIADGKHARIDGFVSLGVVASTTVVSLGAQIGGDAWRTVSRTDPGELHEH